MVDFVASLRAGINAAEAAERARNEIVEVFAELNRQLTPAFDGGVEIKIIDTKVKGVPKSIWAELDPWTDKKYIIAINPQGEDQAGVVLADWEMAGNGYPCKILLPGAKYFCEDRQGLEDALQLMLARPDTGAKIHALINHGLEVA